nr:MAG: internal scaffolding protein [Microviridae sp.]
MVKIFTEWDQNSPRPVIHCDPSIPGEAMCQQHFADALDINNIMAKYEKFGSLPGEMEKIAEFADVSDIPTLQKSQDILIRAQEAWDRIPAELRVRFNNSPLTMMTWLADSKNTEEAQKLGLRKYPEIIRPQDVTINDKTIDAIGASVAKHSRKKASNEAADQSTT